MLTDAPSMTVLSCPAVPVDGQPTRYNPRLLGGGAVIPYIGTWTGEELRPTTVIHRPGGGIGYADETLLDRDERGVLWTRVAGRIGVGKPLFTKLHAVRQRRAMLRLLCQVCAQPADRTDQGQLWLVPEKEIGSWEGWPEGMSAIHPPLCQPCAKLSVRMCPVHVGNTCPLDYCVDETATTLYFGEIGTSATLLFADQALLTLAAVTREAVDVALSTRDVPELVDSRPTADPPDYQSPHPAIWTDTGATVANRCPIHFEVDGFVTRIVLLDTTTLCLTFWRQGLLECPTRQRRSQRHAVCPENAHTV